MITSLPATISAPGDYLLDPAAVTAPVFDNQNGVIYITASNVNLDLNGLTIEAPGDGIQVGANLNHVSITNGTVDGGTAGLLYFGLIIGAGCDHVSVSEVAFTGVFSQHRP
jgi:hypothetical protein